MPKKMRMFDIKACRLVSVPDDLEAAYYIYELWDGWSFRRRRC